jgi:hypothetical protein
MKNKYGTTEKIEEYHPNGKKSYYYYNTLDNKYGFNAVGEYIYNEDGEMITQRGTNYITNYWNTIDEFGNKFSHSFSYPRNLKTKHDELQNTTTAARSR